MFIIYIQKKTYKVQLSVPVSGRIIALVHLPTSAKLQLQMQQVHPLEVWNQNVIINRLVNLQSKVNNFVGKSNFLPFCFTWSSTISTCNGTLKFKLCVSKKLQPIQVSLTGTLLDRKHFTIFTNYFYR